MESFDQLAPLIRGLLRPEAYDHPVQHFDVLETHISWVILTGEFAYKLKKPVDYGFVDFTALERRRFFCHEELRLNRRQTRDLYLAVKPVFGPDDQASFLGPGEPIDYAVQMRQFSQADLLPNVLARGELTPRLLDDLAGKVAEFQAQSPIAAEADEFGSNTSILQVMAANLDALEHAPHHADMVRQLRDWSEREFAKCAAEFVQRKVQGKIREGHGDMHLGNMILRDREIQVFDCLEFNPGLRWIDVISEVAFLVMDLADRGRPDFGWRFLNAWLTQTGDYAGMQVWAWYYCYRALVRAKVAVLRRRQADVSDSEADSLGRQLAEYLQLAENVIRRPTPKLILTHGVSGSGKSYWAQQIASEFGSVWLRSDVERKRLFAQNSKRGRQPRMLYSPEMTIQTYEHLLDSARSMLRSGWSVIIDATFLKRSQRDLFQELAQDTGVESFLLSFTADESTLWKRILERQQAGLDPSDATLDVLEQQLQSQDRIQPDENWTIIPVDSDSSDVIHRLQAR